MKEVEVTLHTLLDIRREKNTELYMKEVQGSNEVELYVQVESSIVMIAKESKTNEQLKDIASYVNKPIILRDKRFTSNNWLSTDTWASSGESTWQAHPDPGHKIIISSIQIRFPKSIKLTTDNKLYFKIFMFYEPLQAVIPVINLEYSSVRELVKKSNNPLMIPSQSVADISSEELIEIEFRYADPYTLKGSPIILRSSLNEYLEIGLTNNVPLKDINGSPYDNTNESWCVVNSKQVYDF